MNYPGTRTNYPGIRVAKKMLQIPGTRVIDTRDWTHYLFLIQQERDVSKQSLLYSLSFLE
jgi:hypothetical protein